MYTAGPHGEKYGYRTSLKKNRKGPIPRSRGAMNLGKTIPVLGMGLVLGNVYNSYVVGDSKELTVEKNMGLPRANLSDKTFFEAHGSTIRRGYFIAEVLWSLR